MSSNFFRGTTAEQDSRWGDAEKKLLRRTKFSKVLEQKVNMKKVNMDVMQRWIAQRITSLLGFEDDIVVGTCVNYLSEEGKLDPKKLQLQLTGFLEKSTGMFMEELWGLLVDAQSSLGGIPSAFLQDKKQELLQQKEQELKQEEELRRRMQEHQQELERAAALKQTEVAAAQEASSSNPATSSRPGGRRASRWGVSQVNTLATPAEEIVEASTAPAAVGDDNLVHTRDRSPSDTSPSQQESDSADRRKEKRKSKKNKRAKKSKKRKRSKKDDGLEKSGDEGTSSDEDGEGGKSSADVEESLRQTLLATMKGRQAQEKS